jgi:hypothetical protein
MSPEAILVIALEIRPVLLKSRAKVADAGRGVLRTLAELRPVFLNKKTKKARDNQP